MVLLIHPLCPTFVKRKFTFQNLRTAYYLQVLTTDKCTSHNVLSISSFLQQLVSLCIVTSLAYGDTVQSLLLLVTQVSLSPDLRRSCRIQLPMHIFVSHWNICCILVRADCKLLKNRNYGKEMEEATLEYEALNNTCCVLLTDHLCGLVVWVSCYRYRGLRFNSQRYEILWKEVGLERGSLSLMRTLRSYLEEKVAAPV
jgi:hypothetical protein